MLESGDDKGCYHAPEQANEEPGEPAFESLDRGCLQRVDCPVVSVHYSDKSVHVFNMLPPEDLKDGIGRDSAEKPLFRVHHRDRGDSMPDRQRGYVLLIVLRGCRRRVGYHYLL